MALIKSENFADRGAARPFIVESLKKGKPIEVVRGWSSGVLKEKFMFLNI